MHMLRSWPRLITWFSLEARTREELKRGAAEAGPLGTMVREGAGGQYSTVDSTVQWTVQYSGQYSTER